MLDETKKVSYSAWTVVIVWKTLDSAHGDIKYMVI